jgi:hypothetical protein
METLCFLSASPTRDNRSNTCNPRPCLRLRRPTSCCYFDNIFWTDLQTYDPSFRSTMFEGVQSTPRVEFKRNGQSHLCRCRNLLDGNPPMDGPQVENLKLNIQVHTYSALQLTLTIKINCLVCETLFVDGPSLAIFQRCVGRKLRRFPERSGVYVSAL